MFVFDLDDFCEEIMTDALWNNIFRIKEKHPKLKITMFTIPLKCSEQWLKNIKKDFDWIEMHYHGTRHEDHNEWINNTKFELPYQDYFYHGFKAPWWEMNQTTADEFDRRGYLLSTAKGCWDVTGKRVYRFNDGESIIGGILYKNGNDYFCHSHVQTQPKSRAGLPDPGVLDTILNYIPSNSEFVFVSEWEKRKNDL